MWAESAWARPGWLAAEVVANNGKRGCDLQKHIEIIKPNFLLLLGATAAKAILSTPLAISKLRNKWHVYTSINLDIKIKTLVSYHPAFLLRSPASKKEAWKDLQFLQKDMNNDTK